MNKKKILITGASGFIGQHLLEDINFNEYNISIITRDKNKTFAHLPKNCTIIVADLANYESLKIAFKNIDVVINVAAEVRNVDQLNATNIKGSENIINAAIANNINKIIHLSSVGVVGMQYKNSPTIINEETTCNPKNDYEKTKLASENIILDGCKKNNIHLTILRPTNVFGENHPLDALLKLIQHINSEKIIISTAEGIANYVYVKDLTDVIIKSINTSTPPIMNVGNPLPFTKLIRTIQEVLNKKNIQFSIPQYFINFANILGIKKLNIISNQVSYNDEQLKSIYNYPVGIEKGLANTIKYYKKAGKLK